MIIISYDTKKDIYIEILRYGIENLDSNVSIDHIINHLKTIGVADYNRNIRDKHTINYIYEKVFHGKFLENGEEHQILNIESYFNFLQYEQLQQARKSSRQAMGIAITALAISISISGLSIYFSCQPTRIDQTQINQIIQAAQPNKVVKMQPDP